MRYRNRGFRTLPRPADCTCRDLARSQTWGSLLLTVPFLWPLHDVPNDEYRYTPFALTRHLQQAGFTDVQLKALGGWNASLAQSLGLWIQRSYPPYRSNLKRPRWQRGIVRVRYLIILSLRQRLLALILLPIVRYLANHDKPPTEFYESSMITGLSGTARKPISSDNIPA